MTKSLILYFSKTNSTKRVAEDIAGQIGAETYRIEEEQPYSSVDLNWNDSSSRANLEQADAKSRPAYAGQVPDITAYDQIIIGHPIWWGRPPRIIETVLDDLDLSGKTLATFATSGGSTYRDAQAVFNGLTVGRLIKGDVINNSRSLSKWLANLD